MKVREPPAGTVPEEGVGPLSSVAVAPPAVVTVKAGAMTPLMVVSLDPTVIWRVAVPPSVTSVLHAVSSVVISVGTGAPYSTTEPPEKTAEGTELRVVQLFDCVL